MQNVINCNKSNFVVQDVYFVFSLVFWHIRVQCESKNFTPSRFMNLFSPTGKNFQAKFYAQNYLFTSTTDAKISFDYLEI